MGHVPDTLSRDRLHSTTGTPPQTPTRGPVATPRAKTRVAATPAYAASAVAMCRFSR